MLWVLRVSGWHDMAWHSTNLCNEELTELIKSSHVCIFFRIAIVALYSTLIFSENWNSNGAKLITQEDVGESSRTQQKISKLMFSYRK